MRNYTFSGYENMTTASHLIAGETCKVIGIGNSMTPILKSRQAVICEPISEDTVLNKKDIVLCKVNGRCYLHLIHAIKEDAFLIGNNHGHMNGWTPRRNVFGKVVEVL